MIKIQNGIFSREPVPDFLQGLEDASLSDLQWTDPALGVQDAAWFPEVVLPVEYDKATHALDPSTDSFLLDAAEGVVKTTPGIRALTEEELAAQAAAFQLQKAVLMAKIDDAVADKIAKSTRFALAYEQREAAAIAYRDAGYTGNPTVWISRFATNTGMTAQQATDLILSQANGLRTALRDLDNLRMDKYLVLTATSPAQAESTCQGIINKINTIVIP